ncbi:lasso peptide biosynthesis PqqD family chaperone [Cohnella thermotolerans]|jgi:hypothetical protein|uniref:lasso peptide biosynthesis PqqD family chaperone n=1 Tax=Cohnella thermotolerans TaxID=329858 RepID=UPI000410F303|nr:lasso peptide biosynthesis PqqD family chaperone [Cohnella thermotolerans]
MSHSLEFPNRLFTQADGNLVSDMNGEKVMLSIQSGKYYNLGEIGGRIWELIASPLSVGQITDILVNEYEVDPAECSQEVERFIQALSKEQLVRSMDALPE